MNPTEERFESWAILELMGHQKMAGLVTEANVAGKGFLRIDVYDAAGENVRFTRMVNPDSVYAINPVERSIALAVGADSHKPVTRYEVRHLMPPASPATADDGDDDEEEGWDVDQLPFHSGIDDSADSPETEWDPEAEEKRWRTKDSPPPATGIF